MAFAALALVGASSPAPEVAAYLAPAPGSDWLESDVSSDLVGVVTPESYSAWVGDDGASARALKRDGFVTGYSRAWEQKVTQDYLREFVLEFRTADAATRWFNDLKLFDETSKYYEKEFPALAIEHSVGAQLKFSDGSREFAIEFAKGNLFFDVTMDADTNDLAATARAQAQTEFDMAPEMTNVAATSAANLSSTAPWVVGLAVVALCFMAVFIGFVMLRSARRQAVPVMTAGFQMSPDRRSWWDGARWRDAAGDIPPGAQRSPDGRYWWDGQAWRPIPGRI